MSCLDMVGLRNSKPGEINGSGDAVPIPAAGLFRLSPSASAKVFLVNGSPVGVGGPRRRGASHSPLAQAVFGADLPAAGRRRPEQAAQARTQKRSRSARQDIPAPRTASTRTASVPRAAAPAQFAILSAASRLRCCLHGFHVAYALSSPSFCLGVVRLGWPPRIYLGEARQRCCLSDGS